MQSSVSYTIVECSRLRRSNNRTLPSPPTLANILLPSPNAMSYTSFSCAISCVTDRCASMSHTLHVVSMLAVPMYRASEEFQSKEVRGAQKSVFLFC